jgi:hypothetical protein
MSQNCKGGARGLTGFRDVHVMMMVTLITTINLGNLNKVLKAQAEVTPWLSGLAMHGNCTATTWKKAAAASNTNCWEYLEGFRT